MAEFVEAVFIVLMSQIRSIVGLDRSAFFTCYFHPVLLKLTNIWIFKVPRSGWETTLHVAAAILRTPRDSR